MQYVILGEKKENQKEQFYKNVKAENNKSRNKTRRIKNKSGDIQK